MKFKGLVHTVNMFAKRHSTKILAGIAIVSEGLGFYFMHKEAPIVRKKLDELGPDAKWYEKVKVAGPIYLPAIGMFALSSTSIIGGCIIGEKRVAAISSLYSVTEAMARKTEEKLVEVLGEEKAQEVHSAVAKEALSANPVNPEDVTLTGHGNVLFFDPLCHRYFRSSVEAVKQANADFKSYVVDKVWGSVNDWYGYLDIGDAELGQYVGWNHSHNIEAWLDADHTSNGELCWVIRQLREPVLYDGKFPVPIEDTKEVLDNM